MANSVVIANLSVNDVDLFIKKRNCEVIFENLLESVLKLPKRILWSFLPPLNYHKQYLFTDVIGPSVSTLILISLLQYGFNCKSTRPSDVAAVKAVPTVLIYYAAVSLFIVGASWFVQTKLKILDVATLIGYSFYGCIITLLFPFILKIVHEHHEDVFYVCLVLFGGLSCIRILMILLFAIEMPVARFLICGVIGNSYILFLIYLYYFYIHPTYVFRNRV